MEDASRLGSNVPRLAVDSSRMRIDELRSLRIPRARASSCLWPAQSCQQVPGDKRNGKPAPAEKFFPPSCTTCSKLLIM